MHFTRTSFIAAGAVIFWASFHGVAATNQVTDCEHKCSQHWSFPAPASSTASSTKTKAHAVSTTMVHATTTYAPPPAYTPEATSSSVVVHNAKAKESSSTVEHVVVAAQTPTLSTTSTPAPVPTSKPAPTPEPASTPELTSTPEPAPTPKLASTSSESSSDVAAYLDPHNAARAEHGASPLTWSDELAAAAQKWANGCVFEHSGGSLGPYGENLAAGSGDYSPGSGVKAWVDEAPQYSSSNPVPSHFTQVVWKATSQVGCAVASCNLANFDKQFWPVKFHVCEYSRAGNVIGQFAENVQA